MVLRTSHQTFCPLTTYLTYLLQQYQVKNAIILYLMDCQTHFELSDYITIAWEQEKTKLLTVHTVITQVTEAQ